MKDTACVYASEALTVLDSRSKIRKNLLAKWFRNSIDGVRFYGFMGQASQLPVVGSFLKKGLHLYYRFLHTNSLIFPLKEIEEVIRNATDIYVDPCGCRLAAGDEACDAPLFVCMRINSSAKLRKEQEGSDGLSKDDALAIMRQARKRGMVFSLESCIQPYQYNICTCCACCCIGMKMRYRWEIDVFHSGPYVPRVDASSCLLCDLCIEKCPVSAMTLRSDELSVDLDRCLGCGICSEICPAGSIEMAIHADRIRQDKEPGALLVALLVLYVHVVMIPSFAVYRLFFGSMKESMETAKPKRSDHYRELMQPGR